MKDIKDMSRDEMIDELKKLRAFISIYGHRFRFKVCKYCGSYCIEGYICPNDMCKSPDSEEFNLKKS